MPTPLQDYQQLQTEIEGLKKDLARAEGAGAQITKQLLEFDCKSVKEAKSLIENLDKELIEAQQEFQTKLEDYRNVRAVQPA